ncbi:MAG: fructose-bisphosphatase class II [bacterium]|nr:fructose-bisphosphatase class II [bacterium]
MDQNYGMELVRATELAALTAALHQGQGDPKRLLNASRAALVRGLGRINVRAQVINDRFMGKEGIMPLPPSAGFGTNDMEIASLSVEGFESTAHGKNNSASFAAIATPGNLMPLPRLWAELIVVPQEAYGVVDLTQPPTTNIKRVARSLKKYTENITVVVLDAPRHHELITQIQSCGARIKRIAAGEISGALSVLTGKADLFMGIGLAPDLGMIAAAIRCLGGYLEGRLIIENDADRALAREFGMEQPERVYKVEDLADSHEVSFAATGITQGQFLNGVHFTRNGAVTHSFVARGESRTFRRIETTHFFDHMPVF